MSAPLVVDVQAHFYPPGYMASLRRIARGGSRAAATASQTLEHPIIGGDPVFTGDVAERLELMDAAGIDKQVVSFAAPNVWSDDVAERRYVTAAFNDGCAELMRERPGRFELLASLPVPFVEQAVAEAERAFDELGAMGVSLCTHLDGVPLDDACFEPLWDFLGERRAAVLLHPEGFSTPGALADYGMDWAIGTPFDDTVAALRLIYGGVLDRHPRIRWIVPHLGGTLPFLAERLDFIWRLNPRVRSMLPEPPTTYLRRLWFDTVQPDARCVKLAGEVLGSDRLLFGSDFPFACREDLGAGLRTLQHAGFGDRERAAIAGRTAADLLGLEATGPAEPSHASGAAEPGAFPPDPPNRRGVR